MPCAGVIRTGLKGGVRVLFFFFIKTCVFTQECFGVIALAFVFSDFFSFVPNLIFIFKVVF